MIEDISFHIGDGPVAGEWNARNRVIIDEIEQSSANCMATILKNFLRKGRADLVRVNLRLRVRQISFRLDRAGSARILRRKRVDAST